MVARYRELPVDQCPDPGIEAIWHSVATGPGSYRVLPDGRCDLILRFQATKDGLTGITPVLTGMSLRFHDVALTAGAGFVGARFRPGHAPRFLGITPAALGHDGKRGAAALALVPALRPLLAPATDVAALVLRLTAFLRTTGQSAAQPDPQTRALVGAFHLSAGQIPVSELAALHGLSPRHLTRKWQSLTGLTPKPYCRILQFQRALRLIEENGLSPAAAAAESGYADQAHMTRAFRQMAGFTPAARQPVTLVTLAP